jgi:hypothetical protein
MVQNWRNYAKYYVAAYIGERDVRDIDGAVCDALYAKLLAEGRVRLRGRLSVRETASSLVAGAGFEPATSGL